MKKAHFTFAFALLCIFSFGQSIHKGSLLGLHTFTVNLKDGVTMEDYVKFFTSKAIPAYDKAFPGMKTYLMKSLRGQDSSSMGVVFIFNSEADRNKYWNKDGTPTELFNAGNAKVSDIEKEMDKYQASPIALDKYNDWLIE